MSSATRREKMAVILLLIVMGATLLLWRTCTTFRHEPLTVIPIVADSSLTKTDSIKTVQKTDNNKKQNKKSRQKQSGKKKQEHLTPTSPIDNPVTTTKNEKE